MSGCDHGETDVIRPASDLSWRRALRDCVPWCGLAVVLTAAAAVGVHVFAVGDGTPLSIAVVLIWSGLTGTLVFPVVAVVAGLSRRSWQVFVLVAGLWFGSWAILGAVAVGYLVFFARRINP